MTNVNGLLATFYVLLKDTYTTLSLHDHNEYLWCVFLNVEFKEIA